MDRVEYEVYENDMDPTQDDTESSKEKVKSIKLMIFKSSNFHRSLRSWFKIDREREVEKQK